MAIVDGDLDAGQDRAQDRQVAPRLHARAQDRGAQRSAP